MEHYNPSKYSLRDAIKIRRLIDFSIQKYPEITEKECLDRIAKMDHQYLQLYLILLFKYKYNKQYHIFQNCSTVIPNNNSGKFFIRNTPNRNKYNHTDFILYLGNSIYLPAGHLHSEKMEYDVVLDFLTQEPLFLDKDVDISDYIQISIPDKIVELPVIEIQQQSTQELYQMTIDGKMSDFILECKDGNLNVSKVILSIHSQYFKNYFQFNVKSKIDFPVKDIRNYLYYCFMKKLNNKDIYPELIVLGRYLLDDSFVKYVQVEMTLKIDEDENIDHNEKIELYNNLITYF